MSERKIVQITSAIECRTVKVFALCDDGTLWSTEPEWSLHNWRKISNVPQPNDDVIRLMTKDWKFEPIIILK